MRHLRAHWKAYAGAVIGAGVSGAALYYGVDPELAREFTNGFLSALLGGA